MTVKKSNSEKVKQRKSQKVKQRKSQTAKKSNREKVKQSNSQTVAKKPKSPTHADPTHPPPKKMAIDKNLSEYELERLERIAENNTATLHHGLHSVLH
jgi:hypothetical protein